MIDPSWLESGNIVIDPVSPWGLGELLFDLYLLYDVTSQFLLDLAATVLLSVVPSIGWLLLYPKIDSTSAQDTVHHALLLYSTVLRL